MSGTILSTEDIELTNKDKIPAFVKLTFDSMLDDKKWYVEKNTSKKAK